MRREWFFLTTIAALAALLLMASGSQPGNLEINIQWGVQQIPNSLLPPPEMTWEPAPPLDSQVAVAELSQLRRARGSVLANSLLAPDESSHEFDHAVATAAGIAPLPAPAELCETPVPTRPTHAEVGNQPLPPSDVAAQLTSMVYELERQADRQESLNQTLLADELRSLATQARKVARQLDCVEKGSSCDHDDDCAPEFGFFLGTER